MTTTEPTDHPLFGEWLMRTDILQRIAYGVKPSDLEGDARAQFFHGQGFAAMVELAEMSQEIGWKPWGSDRGLDRERYLKEGVDVLHFIANLLCLAGITDKELNQAYNAKMRTNLARQQQQGGYAGRLVGKCSSCKRSFDDVGQSQRDATLCSVCDARIQEISLTS